MTSSKSQTPSNNKMYRLKAGKKDGLSARGYDTRSGAFVLLKGSTIRSRVVGKFDNDNRLRPTKTIRDRLIKDGIINEGNVDNNSNFILTKDYEFKNRFRAGQLICGRSISAKSAWIEDDNEPSDDHGISEQSQDCPPTESAPLVSTRPLKSPAGAQEIESRILQQEEARVLSLPRTTEAECWTFQRRGQDLFRRRLMHYWGGRCPLSGINDEGLLRASHIRPWADCRTDSERLDVYNGLLLSPFWDAAFDRGLVTFDEDGRPRFSDGLSETARAALNWQNKPIPLESKHQNYLTWHRENWQSRQEK